MGTTPSKALYVGARQGDIGRIEAALGQGADVNYRNESSANATPLIAAAKHGQAEAVRYLLARGALDLRTASGETALASAARAGHHACCAALLDRGSDHHVRNVDNLRPLELAAAAGHAGTVRLFESRVCPFVGLCKLERPGWFSAFYDWAWIAVHRARPWDNPNVDRREVRLCIYRDVQSPQPMMELVRPALLPVAGADIVDFILQPVATLKRGKPVLSQPVKGRLPRDMYNWLLAVLSDSFATGGGGAFDASTGLVLMTAWGREYVAQFSAEEWVRYNANPRVLLPEYAAARGPQANPAPVVVMPVLQGQQQQQQGQAQAQQRAAPMAQPRAAPQAAQPAPAAQSPRAAPYAPQPVRPVPPPYLTPALLALEADVAADRLHLTSDIPEEYTCPITADLMIDPVVASDGHTYSREGIRQWLALKRTSPKTNEVMETTSVFPNHLLRGQILEWIEADRLRAAATRPTAFPFVQPLPAPPVVVERPAPVPARPTMGAAPQLTLLPGSEAGALRAAEAARFLEAYPDVTSRVPQAAAADAGLAARIAALEGAQRDAEAVRARAGREAQARLMGRAAEFTDAGLARGHVSVLSGGGPQLISRSGPPPLSARASVEGSDISDPRAEYAVLGGGEESYDPFAGLPAIPTRPVVARGAMVPPREEVEEEEVEDPPGPTLMLA